MKHFLPGQLSFRSSTFFLFLFLVVIRLSLNGAQAHAAPAQGTLPGMPAPLDPRDLYAADRPGELSDTVKNFPSRVYVPNSGAGTVDVIDPATYKVVDHFVVGKNPPHIVPSYDMKSLWVLNDQGWTLTRIDPATGKKAETVQVDDPYNLYFTPEGKY